LSSSPVANTPTSVDFPEATAPSSATRTSIATCGPTTRSMRQGQRSSTGNYMGTHSTHGCSGTEGQGAVPSHCEASRRPQRTGRAAENARAPINVRRSHNQPREWVGGCVGGWTCHNVATYACAARRWRTSPWQRRRTLQSAERRAAIRRSVAIDWHHKPPMPCEAGLASRAGYPELGRVVCAAIPRG
jgi:hypothetical protein